MSMGRDVLWRHPGVPQDGNRGKDRNYEYGDRKEFRHDASPSGRMSNPASLACCKPAAGSSCGTLRWFDSLLCLVGKVSRCRLAPPARHLLALGAIGLLPRRHGVGSRRYIVDLVTAVF